MKRTIAAIIAVSLVGYFAVRIPRTGYTLFELERSGRVPDGANGRTWRACESTFWWGKRLDPDAFWSNRVVWLSREVEIAANRQGRLFPPIPSGDNRFSERSDRDHAPLVTWDGIIRAYHSSERESAYWDWFGKHMPRPPDTIDRVLERAVDEWMSIKNWKPSQPAGLKIPPTPKEERLSWMAKEYINQGFPKEAFSSGVLDWEYVRYKRKERIAVAQEPDESWRKTSLNRFDKTLVCSKSLVVSEPSDEEIRVTNGWRIEYLRRLRREGTDESYIEAYKKAWNLSEDDLREDAE